MKKTLPVVRANLQDRFQWLHEILHLWQDLWLRFTLHIHWSQKMTHQHLKSGPNVKQKGSLSKDLFRKWLVQSWLFLCYAKLWFLTQSHKLNTWMINNQRKAFPEKSTGSNPSGKWLGKSGYFYNECSSYNLCTKSIYVFWQKR